MRLGTGRSPPTDGKAAYHFPIGGVTIHGRTKTELITGIFEYRLRNNLPTGADIEREVDDYYCTKWPSFCHEDAAGISPSPKAKAAEMLQRVAQWISNLARKLPRGGYDLTSQAEAERRAAICAQCPKNGHWKSGCGGCDAATLQLLQQVRQLRKTSRDGNLSACQIGGWENATAVWLAKEQLFATPEQVAQMPEPCWRKAL